MRIREEKQATDLFDVINNFQLSALTTKDSKFYVDTNDARTGRNGVSVRRKIVKALLRCDRLNNETDIDDFTYCKFLLIGHKGCGKSTELHLIENELTGKYETIYVPDIEQQQSRLTSQEDFLYYVIEKVVAYCKKDDKLRNATYKEVEKLRKHLQESIFGKTDIIIEKSSEQESGIEAGIETKLPFIKVLDFMGSLGYKETFSTETKNTLNVCIRNTMQQFVDISNQIFNAMRQVCRESGKMPLLILDGLDKVYDNISEGIFLGTQSFLPKLECSMIVTFPLYLNYSPKYQQAIRPFDEVYFLSTIPVNNIDGTSDDDGRGVLKDIIKKRINIDEVVENPDSIDKAIAKSGGNLRELFNFIRNAAANADALDKDKISETDFENIYQDEKNIIMRQMNNGYKTFMKSVYDGTGKETIVTEKDETGTLLDLFNSGLLLEYNGKRWIDLNPLVREIIDEYGDSLWKH